MNDQLKPSSDRNESLIQFALRKINQLTYKRGGYTVSTKDGKAFQDKPSSSGYVHFNLMLYMFHIIIAPQRLFN